MLALQISEELVGEQLLSENDLLGATVHKEYEKDGGELGPSHFILSAFDHGKTDSGNTGSVTEILSGTNRAFCAERRDCLPEFLCIL